MQNKTITATRRKSDSKKTNRSKMITKIHRVKQYDYKDTKLRDVNDYIVIHNKEIHHDYREMQSLEET